MKKNKLPSIISLLILTLMTVVVWVSLNVYRAFTVKQPESVPEEISAPITPTLNLDVIKQIESSIYLTGTEIPDNVTAKPVVEPVVVVETPVATPSAAPTI